MIDSWDSATKMLASAFSDIDVDRGGGEAEIKNDAETSVPHHHEVEHPVWEEGVWLTKWNRNESRVKDRLMRRKSTKSRNIHSARQVFTNISLEDYVAEESVPKDVYFVTLNAPNGVGMNLFVSFEGLVLVQGLYKLRNGSSSPAQNCGVIAVGDQLVQLNDINIEALSFYETTDLLKDLDLLAKDKIITLGFRYMDSPVTLPPEAEELDATSTSSSELYRKDVDIQTPPPQLGHYQGHTSLQDMLSLRQSPMVEDAFLALFALDEASSLGNANPDGIASGVSRSRADPTPFISELDTLHQQMRQRHMYPAAARVSALSGTTHPVALLHELAEEVYEWRPVHLCRQYAGYYTPRATSDVNTAYGAVLSGLIVSPQDTAIYQNTQQLVWCEEKRCYVEPAPPLAAVPGTFVDTAECMQEVLRKIERDYQERMSFDCVSRGDIRRGGGNADTDLSLSTKLTSQFAKERVTVAHPICVGSSSASSIYVHGTSLIVGSVNNTSTNTSTTRNCTVKPTLYSTASAPAAKKQPYYYLKQSHFISKEHSAVQQLLSLPSTAILAQLSGIVDSAIESISSMNTMQTTTTTDNPYLNAKHYETNTEISIPPMLLTYQLLYTAQHLKPILLHNEAFLSLLEQWAATFDPRGMLQALQSPTSQHRNSTTDNVKATHSANRRSFSPAGLRTTPTTHDSSKMKEFLVFFNNDPSTARNLQPFVDVIRELLTFVLVCRVSPDIVRVTRVSSGTSGVLDEMSITGGNNSSNSVMGKSFRLLPITIDLSLNSANDRNTIINNAEETIYPDPVAASFVRKFGALLFLDTVAVNASSAHYTRTLQATIDAARRDKAYSMCTLVIQELVAKSVGTMLSAQQLIDQLSGSTNNSNNNNKTEGTRPSNTNNASSAEACPYVLCLLLEHLETIFAQNSQLALDLTTLLYPLIAPWNVQHTLFPTEEHENCENEQDTRGLMSTNSINLNNTERGAESVRYAEELGSNNVLQGVGVSSSVNTSTATSLSSSAAPSPVASPHSFTRSSDNSRQAVSIQSPPLLPPLHTLSQTSLCNSTQATLPLPLPENLSLPPPRSNSSKSASITEPTTTSKVQLSSHTERELDRLLSRTSSNQSLLSTATAAAATSATTNNNVLSYKPLNITAQAPQHSLQGGLCAQNAYYSYLTRLFRMHTSLCRNSPVLVLSWLETALSLAHQDSFHAGNDAFSAFASVFATPKGKKKNPFAITVRNLLHSPEQYTMDIISAMELCAKFGHVEGVVALSERLLHCDTGRTADPKGCETLLLHAADLTRVLNVLNLATGKQLALMVKLVNQIYESELKSGPSNLAEKSNNKAYRSSDYQSIYSTTVDSPMMDSVNSMCAAVTALLRSMTLAARALSHQPPQQQHEYQLWQSGNDSPLHQLTSLTRRFESPEWSICGDILNTIALEQFYEVPAQTNSVYERVVLSCVSNMIGESVRFAVGTENALLMLQHAPVLVELLTC